MQQFPASTLKPCPATHPPLKLPNPAATAKKRLQQDRVFGKNDAGRPAGRNNATCIFFFGFQLPLALASCNQRSQADHPGAATKHAHKLTSLAPSANALKPRGNDAFCEESGSGLSTSLNSFFVCTFCLFDIPHRRFATLRRSRSEPVPYLRACQAWIRMTA